MASATEQGTALETQAINAIRILSIDAVQAANSGHPGLPMGAAPMAYVLWHRVSASTIRAIPQWPDRDRFVLSAGHGSALLYSLLHLTGYDLSLERAQELPPARLRTPGHPERGHTPGVEVTTGPLGQGFANGVGMAIAEQFLAATYNRPTVTRSSTTTPTASSPTATSWKASPWRRPRSPGTSGSAS